jgi:hypothetical protein
MDWSLGFNLEGCGELLTLDIYDVCRVADYKVEQALS